MEHSKIIDYSPEHKLNPDNTPWKPGYRFGVSQISGKRGSTRTYFVGFKIDADGKLVWTGGVKARPETFAKVQAVYDREKLK